MLAALLHDIGHLCSPSKVPRMGGFGVANHEDIGADHLWSLGFGPQVTNLVRGHVEAKRYLVATSEEYTDRFSDASRANAE